jgi:BirA family biotin operon repressor/biotin-[acetyl-CoA-carboxylase] ligase
MRKRGELFAPAVVLAGRQTAGRGRAGNRWWSGTGVLTVTFAMPIEEHLLPQQIPLVAGLAARNSAAQLAENEEISLKWPNDLVYQGRKLAGLLCERVHRVDLIGLGVNLNLDPSQAPPSLRQRITSLSAIAGREFDPTQALICLAREIYRMLSRRGEHPFPAIIQEYDRHHALVGRRITVTASPAEGPITGLCQGLDQWGRLIVRNRSKTYRIVAGHVEPI